MPKMKTKSGAKKRFRFTATGKHEAAAFRVLRRHGVGKSVHRRHRRLAVHRAYVGAGDGVHPVLVDSPALQRLNILLVEIEKTPVGEWFR